LVQSGHSKDHQISRRVREKWLEKRFCLSFAVAAAPNPQEPKLLRWFFPIMLSLGCSVSWPQIERNACKWKTWVLTSGDQLRLPPPPDETATRAEIAQLKDIAKQRNAGTLERTIWWNAGPPGYRWTSVAIPPGPTNASLHSRIMALLSVAIYDATVAAWDSKYALQPAAPDRLRSFADGYSSKYAKPPLTRANTPQLPVPPPRCWLICSQIRATISRPKLGRQPR
jgi:hypothetical protein